MAAYTTETTCLNKDHIKLSKVNFLALH